MVNLNELDMGEVRDHYVMREQSTGGYGNYSRRATWRLYDRLALGITEGPGNYSASEHVMGPRILAVAGAEQDVFDLATAIEACVAVNRLPTVIYERNITNLKISVGSEMAMMLRPDIFWVGNKRTIWSQLLVSHDMNQRPANEALRLYYSRDDDSEMDYPVWRDLYLRAWSGSADAGAAGCGSGED